MTEKTTNVSKESDPEVVGFIVVDIETTGRRMMDCDEGKDVCFAIGFGHGTSIDDVETEKVCLDMGKQTGESWKEFWKKNKFENRCYEQFWSKNESVLDDLQNREKLGPNLVKTEAEMMARLQSFLVRMEKLYSQTVLITDTTAFDTVWLSYLLEKHGYAHMGYKRDGSYSKGLEMQSYRMATYGISSFSRKDKSKPWEMDAEYQKKVSIISHDHDPSNDARQILTAFLYCVDMTRAKELSSNELKTTIFNTMLLKY